MGGDAPTAAVPKLLKPLTMYIMLQADMYARQLLPRQWEDMLPDLEWPAGWVPEESDEAGHRVGKAM